MQRLAVVLSLLFAVGAIACDEDEQAPPMADEPAEAEVATDDDEAGDDGIDDGPADADDEPDLADDLDPGESRHFGEPFTIDDDPIDLTDALARLDDADEGEPTSTLKVEATVEQVCQKKGCWFTLDDDAVDRPVRVRMKDYGFFVPRNTADGHSIIEGTVEKTTIDEELARHYAEDSGDDPDAIDGPQSNYKFTATGISMTAPDEG